MQSPTPGTLPDQLLLGEDITLYSFSVDQTSYLVVRNGKSLLVNCHTPNLRKLLQYRRLPMPELILHTHVTPELCREGKSFPEALTRVPEGLEVLAGDHEAWHRQAHTVWDEPEKWGDTGGGETFGVAGCITMFPPAVPLELGPSIKAGESFDWQGLTIEPISLPAYGGVHALGFLLSDGARPLALFTGDLLRHPSVLVDVHGLERRYGGTCLEEMPALLRGICELGTDLFLPSRGPMLLEGPRQARELADKIDAFIEARAWTSGRFVPAPAPASERLGRWCRVHDGVYQFQAPGNTIVFIDKGGNGLVFDPGPCEYGSPTREADFVADFALLEEEAGLKRVELTLVTHHHGDHYDLAPLLIQRYGCAVGAWDLTARVLKAPWDFPYCCTLPWYNLGFEYVPMDLTLSSETPYMWHDVEITCVHLPGHSYCHGGYILDFNGKRFAITGDSIQNQGDASALGFIIGNHSVPGKQGDLAAYRTMMGRGIDLNLGGHGSRFAECEELYAESVRRIEHAMPYLEALIPEGDFRRAFMRPGFPDMDLHG